MQDEVDVAKAGGLIRFLPLLLIVTGLVVVIALELHRYLSFEHLKAERRVLAAFVAARPLIAATAFVGVLVVFALVLFPGTVFWSSITGGFLFGLAGGVALTVLGATAGATALFFIARSTLGAPLHRHAGPFLRKVESGFQENPFSYMLTMRLLPIVPFPVSNVAPALLGVRPRDFVVATFVGLIPCVIAYGLIGTGLGAAFDSARAPDIGGLVRPLLPAFFALAAMALAPALLRRLRARRAA